MKVDGVRPWVNEQLSVIATGATFRSIGLDFLLGKEFQRPWSVDQAISAYVSVVEACGERVTHIMPALVIPLAYSKRPKTKAPSRSSLDLAEVEVPTIYLRDRADLAARFDDFETYRIPLDWELPEVEVGGITAIYSCFRDPRSRTLGWEYSRAIWVQHYLLFTEL
jgi:hypothetical protein